MQRETALVNLVNQIRPKINFIFFASQMDVWWWFRELDPLIKAWLPPRTGTRTNGGMILGIYRSATHTFEYGSYDSYRPGQNGYYEAHCAVLAIENHRVPNGAVANLHFEESDNELSVWEPGTRLVHLLQPSAMKLWKAFSTKFPSSQHDFNSKELETWLRSNYIEGRADPISSQH